MDLSMPKMGTVGDALKQEHHYPAFAAPTPINLSRSYPSNTLTPGSLPSPLNFPSITPPSSPYSFYGLYSPVTTPRVSPMYDPSYLKRLKSNPIFRDLQSVLRQECSQMEVPANLITTSWNLMHLHKASGTDQSQPTSSNSTNDNTQGSGQKVYIRHMQLQDKLLKVRIDPAISADGLSVENGYSKEVGNIEMNRYRALHTCPNNTLKTTINNYYDKERLELADRTEEKLDSLINKAEKMRQAAQRANSERTTAAHLQPSCDSNQGKLSNQECSAQGASLLLQPVDDNDAKLNAVRQLKFNFSDEHPEEEDEENDYLNGSVNSEDFEIDEIDVETVDKEESRAPTPEEFDNPKSNNSDLLQQCIEESGLGSMDEVDTNSDTSNSPCNSESGFSAVPTHKIHNATLTHSVGSPACEQSVTSTTCIDKVSDHKLISHGSRLPFPVTQYPTMQEKLDQGMFGTPQNYGHKFLQPDQINFALSEIGKMCGGPTVTFSPELRREIIPSVTPEVTEFSPFGMSAVRPNCSTASQNTRTWHSPLNVSCNYSNSTGSGQKRKSPFDDEESEVLTSQQQQTNSEINGSHEVSSATEPDTSDNFLNNPHFKTHRTLTADATNILSHWYTTHVQYPYPNDEEVKQLSQLTGITARQVKKWMANKRVRCFNTLSITGNQHPIKFKYSGKGRKKKTAVEKENCDSTTSEKKGNYSLLNEEAKIKLNFWYEAHIQNPYPTEEEKQELAQACNISVSQVKSWFANKRNRMNNTKRQVPNYFINKYPEYSSMVQFVGQKREEARMVKRRKVNEFNMYIQPSFYF